MPRSRHVPSRLAALLAVSLAIGLLPFAARPAAGADPGIQPRAEVDRPLTHEVYGYLPYWRLDAATAGELRYELLSTIAFFGLGIKADGNIDIAWRGYTAYVSANAVAVTNAAHAQGVRVVPTFQMFDKGTLPKMTAFLGSTPAQDRFIGQALDLMARRSADGANFDFEPMPASMTPRYLAFLGRFRAAMDARFPGATLVNASSAGAGAALISGLVPIVDHQFVMTYNYRWTGSTVTGAIAPLDHASRNVKIHMKRFMAYAPRETLILGVPYYGYDWPVMSTEPHATVRADKTKYGAVKSVTYASARNFLAAHPEVSRYYDALEGSAFFTYWEPQKATWRQVYFEDERSAAEKYDYAIDSKLAGIGIWTLGNDRGYEEMWDALEVFNDPHREVNGTAVVRSVSRRDGSVHIALAYTLRNVGEVRETGTIRWLARRPDRRPAADGVVSEAALRAGRDMAGTVDIRLGSAAELPAGPWSIELMFVTDGQLFRSPRATFRQPF